MHGYVHFNKYIHTHNKALLLDITIVNPCAGSNLGNAARHVGKHLADAVERKKNKYRGSFPATYSLLPLAMSTCGDVGSDVHALIKELADGYSTGRRHTPMSPNIWRKGQKKHVFGGDSLLFYSRYSHSARVAISADRGWRLRTPDGPIRKARRRYKRILPGG